MHRRATGPSEEDLPDEYFFSSRGQSIGSFYITFGPNVTGLSISRFGGYDDSGFPSHSGVNITPPVGVDLFFRREVKRVLWDKGI